MQTSLLIFAHPALEQSQVNRRLLNCARSIETVSISDLYEAYPDFMINVSEQQSLLEAHDRIIFQFPFYWYSTPALLKQWFDLVLTYGWAYGEKGTALSGKQALVITTTGGTEASYSSKGHNNFTMDALLRPIQQTAVLCNMRWQRPLVLHNALHMDAGTLQASLDRYQSCLEGICTDK